eukprot:TRINITY_DN3904_c0_g1_i1.p1 TRINITY_DN3904_c0_g1~~TRINITY_DN3904_c0_g1_i1.p1  ORF type:complete len:1063 (+),score=179.99 TRINITY_DN3904_c0_g1_i1:77-3265(+)
MNCAAEFSFGGEIIRLQSLINSTFDQTCKIISERTQIPHNKIVLVSRKGHIIQTQAQWRSFFDERKDSTRNEVLFVTRGKERPSTSESSVGTQKITPSRPNVLPQDWNETCTRVWLGPEKNVQLYSISQGKSICNACLGTCFLPGQCQAASLSQLGVAVSCECSIVPNHECLYAARQIESEEIRDQALRQTIVAKLKQDVTARTSRAPPASSATEQQFRARLMSGIQQMRTYEDELLQSRALSVIPEDLLQERAEKILQSTCKDVCTREDFREELLKQLLHWFKKEFFRWVNQPLCPSCKTTTKQVGGAHPTAEEGAHGARVVEVYSCPNCRSMVRFPRYNDPGKLLETREGRCGEWANCFTLCCISMGYDARWVMDWTDHVWTEVYSDKHQRWIHLDPCEDAYDSPMMYDAGWGKKLTYIIGFTKHRVVDVTRRYVRNISEALGRRDLVSEEWLSAEIIRINTQLRTQVSHEQLAILESRSEAEEKQLQDGVKLSQERSLNQQEVEGRSSGSADWKQSRGESGSVPRPFCITDVFSTDIPATVPPTAVSTTHVNLADADVSKWDLVGSAKYFVNGGTPTITLTSATPDQRGAAWIREKINVQDGFVIDFSFCMSGGADGMAFVIQNHSANALGEGGCQLGYGGIPNSIAVEFDTYCSSDRCNDPNDNHIAINTRGQNANTADHSASLKTVYQNLPRLADNHIHHARIICWKGTLELFLNSASSATITAPVDIGRLIKCDDAAAMGLSPSVSRLSPCSYVWLGFTASTGGLCQSHSITNVSVRSLSGAAECTTHTFDQISVNGMLKKIEEFNTKVPNALSVDEMSRLKDSLQLISTSSCVIPMEKLVDMCKTIEKIMQWGESFCFPGLDLARWLSFQPTYETSLVESGFVQQFHSLLDGFSFHKGDAIFRTVLYRLQANIFSSSKATLAHKVDLNRTLRATLQLQIRELQANELAALVATIYNIGIFISTSHTANVADFLQYYCQALTLISEHPSLNADQIYTLLLLLSILCDVKEFASNPIAHEKIVACNDRLGKATTTTIAQHLHAKVKTRLSQERLQLQ